MILLSWIPSRSGTEMKKKMFQHFKNSLGLLTSFLFLFLRTFFMPNFFPFFQSVFNRFLTTFYIIYFYLRKKKKKLSEERKKNWLNSRIKSALDFYLLHFLFESFFPFGGWSENAHWVKSSFERRPRHPRAQ